MNKKYKSKKLQQKTQDVQNERILNRKYKKKGIKKHRKHLRKKNCKKDEEDW